MQGDEARGPVGPDVWEVCRELIPPRSVFAFLAEHRRVLFPAGMFADMYPSPNGRPSCPPQVLSTVVVLQVLHGLSDVEAVQALKCDLRWKAACGLGLLDGGFDPSLLTYFRRRLQHSRDPHRIFTAVRQVVEATGILHGRHRRALDSTVFQDAVATQDTITQLIAAIRRIARDVPGGTQTVTAHCTGHDYLAAPASRPSPGTTSRPGPNSSTPWSPTPSPSWPTCPSRTWTRGPRTRSASWPWSPGRTWNPPRAPT